MECNPAFGGRHATPEGDEMNITPQEIRSQEFGKKFRGYDPDEVLDFVKSTSELKGIKVKGLMTVGLFTSDVEKARPCFRILKELFEKIKSENIPGIDMKYLSMGMTSDYEVAIEEGSNMLRIGTAIFGERKG